MSPANFTPDDRAERLRQALQNTLLRAIATQAGADAADRIAHEVLSRISALPVAELGPDDDELISAWLANVLTVLRRA